MHLNTIPSSVIEPIDPVDIDLATESEAEAEEIVWREGLMLDLEAYYQSADY
jgi:hypothetical protein